MNVEKNPIVTPSVSQNIQKSNDFNSFQPKVKSVVFTQLTNKNEGAISQVDQGSINTINNSEIIEKSTKLLIMR